MINFTDFLQHNPIDKDAQTVKDQSGNEAQKQVADEYPALSAVFKTFGGRSFDGGIFRAHTVESAAKWSNLLKDYFPDFEADFFCFGYDWLGCMYGYAEGEEPTVYIFDPADMDVREALATIDDFFNIDLVEYRNETLMLPKLTEMGKEKYNGTIAPDKCIGYKQSLFLGGADAAENMEVWDLEVYWESQAQIYEQIKDLPDGTVIGDTTTED